MTEIVKRGTLYNVDSTEGTLIGTGDCTISIENLIQNLYVNYTVDNVFVGSANYSENKENFNYNYSISDKSYKKAIEASFDKTVTEIKSKQLS